MAWRYCSCECSLDNPTTEQIIRGELVCPECDKQHGISENDKDTLLVELVDKVGKLEKIIKLLAAKSSNTDVSVKLVSDRLDLLLGLKT
jgi:hypothetical protein